MSEPTLPEGWSSRSLASLGQYENGFAFNDQHWSEEGLPIVRIAQITGSQEIVDRFPGQLPEKFRLASGDMIFSWSGTLAVVRWDGGPAWLNQHLFKVTSATDVDDRFMFHVLSESVAEFDKRAHGSTMKHIKRGELAEYSVGVPDNPKEQSKIAEVLDTLDAAIRGTEAVVAKLKAMKQGLLHDLLTRGINANGDLRPPHTEVPHLYKETPLGWLPKEWDEPTLEEITGAPICYGIVQVFGFVENGVPVLAIRDLLGDFRTNIHRTAKHIDAQYPRSRVKPGDVLLSIKGTIGRVGVVPDHFEGNISRDIGLLRPNNRIISDYLALFLTSSIGQGLLKDTQVGTTRAELSIGPLKKLRIPLPSPEEQKLIATRVISMDGKIHQEALLLDKLRLQKSGLMDDLLTGRVPVTPLLGGEAAHGA